MNDEDRKLLELYLKDLRKKKIIVVVIAAVIVFIALIILSIYYKHFALNTSKNTQAKNENTNEIEDIKEENIVMDSNENLIVDNIVETNDTIEVTNEKNKEETKIDTEVKDTKVEENKNTNVKKNENTNTKPANKDFLFADGYTMDNVTQAAEDYLKSFGTSGECIPIKNCEGIYIGMKVIFH